MGRRKLLGAGIRVWHTIGKESAPGRITLGERRAKVRDLGATIPPCAANSAVPYATRMCLSAMTQRRVSQFYVTLSFMINTTTTRYNNTTS